MPGTVLACKAESQMIYAIRNACLQALDTCPYKNQPHAALQHFGRNLNSCQNKQALVNQTCRLRSVYFKGLT
jgi:hypothetical protein